MASSPKQSKRMLLGAGTCDMGLLARACSMGNVELVRRELDHFLQTSEPC